MVAPWIIIAAIVAASTAISYVMTKKAQKKAKQAADEMAGVLINKESNVEPIPVIYGVRRVGGVRVFVSTRDADGGDPNEFLYICLVLCEGEVQSITNIHIDDKPITDSRYSGLYTINVHTGADNQNYDSLLTEANAGWTSAHKLSGVAYLAIKLKWDTDVFSGVPEITALVTGRKVYDPRSPSAAAAFSNNPALCIRDYLTNNRYGKGLASSKIDDVAFSAAATDCDQSVLYYTNGTTGKIFETNAVLQTDETLFENLQKILMGCRGFLPYNQGVYSLKIDKSGNSVYAFTTDNMVGGIAITGESKENKFNRINVKFANPAMDYQPDTATWPDADSSEETAFLAADNGTLLVSDISLPTVTNYYAARDLARVILLRSRNALRVSIQTTSEAMQLSVGDVVTVNHPTPNWGNKPFQVEELSLNYDGTCNLSLLEYDSSIYTYDLSAQEVTYPDTNLPDPFSVVPPGSLSTSATTTVALDGTIVPQINVSWVASTDSFVNQYDLQFSTDNSNFQSIITDQTQYIVSPVIAGATYYFKVFAINALGVRSTPVSANQGSVGDTAAPALPTTLSAHGGYKSINLVWTNPSDKDFSNVEVYRSTSSSGTYSIVATVGGGWGTKAEFLNGGLGDATAYYFKFKSVDYSGNKSAFTSVVNATTNAAAIDGTNGQSTFLASIFKRDTSAGFTPSGGTFNFGTNTLTPPSGWYTSIPSGTNPVYVANFLFAVSGDTGTVTAGNWTTPVISSENGDDGTNGLSTFVFSVYKRIASTPSNPSGGSYNFGTNAITAPTGWSASPPTGTDPVYVSTTTAQITGNTGVDSSLTWTNAVLLVKNGINGDDGDDGVNTAPVYAYKRSSSALGSTDKPTTTRTWTFATATFNNTDLGNGWTSNVSTGSNDLYICAAVASSTGETDNVVANDWAAPQLLAAEGTDGTNGVNTAVVYGYKRSASTVSNKPSITRTWTFTTGTFNNSDLGNSFTSTIPSGTDNLYVCNAVASSVNSTDSVTGTSDWSSPQLLASNGINGGDGKSTFTAPIFKRATSAPSAPTGGTFNFSTNTLTAPTGWAIAVPSGTNPIYQANFQFSISGDTGTVTAGTWSTPVIIAENGGDGTDGLSTFTFAVHKRASSTPSSPSGGSYNFGTNAITAPSGWSETIPSGTDPIYISSTRAQISGATGTDSSLSWTAPIVFAINGDNGDDGVNTAPVYAYKRSSSALASSNKPTTTRTWTFANASFGNDDLGNGWTGDIPTGTNDLYICAAVASSTSTTDEIVAADWSAPQVLGTQGEDGDNGVNTAVVYGYKRSSSTVSDKPSTTRTWTFSSGTFNNNDLGNSFTGTIPSGTNDLYVCTAVAASQSSTDTVTGTSDWGSPQLLASNGINGDPGAAGPRNAQGFLYYSVSGSQPNAPTATSFNFATGAFSGLTTNWSRTPPAITGGDAAYWATSFTVVEATLNGNQTKTFSTPFSSFAFNGLVTFSNLNNELADGTSSSEITTINGARIQTGTLDVSQVNISGTTQSNFNLQSAGSGSRMKITNDTIEIYDGSVLRVKLGNL